MYDVKNKMKFCGVIKSLFVFVVALMASNACAMQQLENPKLEDLFVQNFKRMTFKEAHVQWDKLPIDGQEKIEIAENKRNKEKINLIFEIVRSFPPEIHENIILLFCNGKPIPAKKFLKMP